MTRIYAACLASYNNGCLHGAWIDAHQDVDSIRAEIDAMLRASPYPNVTRCHITCAKCEHIWTCDVSPYTAVPACCPECHCTTIIHGTPYASAEEFAIHDHEGFHGLVGEYTPIDEVVWTAEALEEHGSKYAGLRNHGYNHIDALQKIEEDYCGEYDSLMAWAEQYTDDSGLFSGVSDDSPLRMYFDFASFALDARLGGDVMTVDDEDTGTIHVFYNR